MIDVDMWDVGRTFRLDDFPYHDFAQLKLASAFEHRLTKSSKYSDNEVVMYQGELTEVIANKPFTIPLYAASWREKSGRVSSNPSATTSTDVSRVLISHLQENNPVSLNWPESENASSRGLPFVLEETALELKNS